MHFLTVIPTVRRPQGRAEPKAESRNLFLIDFSTSSLWDFGRNDPVVTCSLNSCHSAPDAESIDFDSGFPPSRE